MQNNTVLIHDVPQRSKQWFALRKGRVTASNAYTLLTKGLAMALQANDKRFGGNYFTDRGLQLEPQAIYIYEQKNGVDILQVGFITNSKYPNAGVSPDGVTADTYIEVKAFNAQKHLDIHTIDDVPIEAVAQVQFGLMITELPLAHLVLYNPDVDTKDAFKVIAIPADLGIHKNMAKKLAP